MKGRASVVMRKEKRIEKGDLAIFSQVTKGKKKKEKGSPHLEKGVGEVRWIRRET